MCIFQKSTLFQILDPPGGAPEARNTCFFKKYICFQMLDPPGGAPAARHTYFHEKKYKSNIHRDFLILFWYSWGIIPIYS